MILSRLKNLLSKSSAKARKPKKRVLKREEHTVSRQDISRAALKVLYGLNKAGYEAYLVGGGVRDVLLNKHPKDFDVATNARPEEVQKVFRNARLIGRRFKLVHVMFGPDTVEVATFRAAHDESPQTEHGMVLRDNVYGTIEEDAVRRDFTVNALYYNIADFSVIDFLGGLHDLEHKTLRLIGDPETRYREDPVRMLRAARLAAKLGFSVEKNTRAPIAELAPLLHNVSHARLWDESVKMLLTGHAEASYETLIELDLFSALFPQADAARLRDAHTDALYRLAMRNTDERVHEDKGVNPAFLAAVLLWPCVAEKAAKLEHKGLAPALAVQHAMDDVLDEQHKITAIAKRFSLTMREMWVMQWRMTQRTPSRAERLLAQPRFRAGFDLLALRAQAGDDSVRELYHWWDDYQVADADQRLHLCKSISKPLAKSEGTGTGPRRRARRGGTRNRKPRAPGAE